MIGLRSRCLLVGLVLLSGVSALARGETVSQGHWFIFLESGKPTPDDKEAVAKMQRGHIDNFKRLFAERKLLAAGPLRDPARIKRGIVVVRAASVAELLGYFQPDEYVRDGYMTVNAVPARVNKALNSEGIDDSAIEEVRIVQIQRPAARPAAEVIARQGAFLQGLLDKGTLGAWYTLENGPVAEVLFARTTDTAMLETTLSGYPRADSQPAFVSIWSQWLGKGVLR